MISKRAIVVALVGVNLFLLAVLVKGVSSRQALIATIIGVIVVSWATITTTWLPEAAWGFPLHAMMIGVCGTLVIVLAGWFLDTVGKTGSANTRQ